MGAGEQVLDRSTAFASLAGTSLAIALGAFWSGPMVDAEPRPIEIQRTTEVDHPELEPALDEDLARAAALVAEYSGEGVIHCTVGRQMLDGAPRGLRRAQVQDGVLVATVQQPAGHALVRGPFDAMTDDPRFVVRWREAWPGERGGCEVSVPERVPVDGWLVRRDGAAVATGEVRTELGVWPVLADGTFEASCWYQLPCTVQGRARPGASWSRPHTLVPDGPMYGVELVLTRPPASADVLETLEAEVVVEAAAEAMVDPFVLALADPRLPPASRPTVEAWHRQEASKRRSLAGLLEGMRVSLR